MEILNLGWLLLIPLIWLYFAKKKIENELKEAKLREAFLQGEKKIFEGAKEKFEEIFKLHSSEAIHLIQKKSDEEALKMLNPVKETLNRLHENMKAIELERRGEKEILKGIQEETKNLTNALRKPDIRGLWGELQLKRAIELAGLVNQCDFFEQAVSEIDDRIVRPDLIIRLPGEKSVIVDSKVPFEAFLEASNESDLKLKEEKLKDHTRLIKHHIQSLSKKAYWERFQPTPEFVILFLPTDVFLSAALENDPSLIETAALQGIVIATPTTLIGLLKAIAYGWKQDTFSKHAKEISELGHELYKRLNDMSKHLNQMGRSLSSSVDSYNKAMGSFDKRVLVSARKLKDMGAASNEIDLEDIEMIEKIPKESLIDVIQN
jgi:DNA recombination protein RmuC